MKTIHLIQTAIATGLLLVSCMQVQQTTGSVSPENVAEMMQSPRMAITLDVPGWILMDEKDAISPLKDTEIAALREILTPGRVRKVPEKFYHETASGNRGDDSDMTFYLYASNAQCLGGRVVGDLDGEWSVKMDDFSLTEEQETALKTLLTPHLVKIKVLPHE